VKFAVVARQLPDPAGTAAGRALRAWCAGVLAEGHELDVWSWSPEPPTFELPPWCTWRPLPAESRVQTRVRAALRPRSDVIRGAWAPAGTAVAVADDVPSFAAVATHRHSVSTLHYRTAIDAAALGRRSLRDVQDRRAERRAVRMAWLTLAYSGRAGSGARGRARLVPIAYDVPAEAMPPVDEPRVALVADWRWAPNRVALATLLSLWPDVRARVPDAQLVVAGRGDHIASVPSSSGVRVLGEVARAEDVLAGAALVAFPCPPTSGPKMKVLEALAHGVPVVTTAAGVEGLFLGDTVEDLVVESASASAFANRLVALLSAPDRRASIAGRARHAVAAAHSPRAAARARVDAITAALSAEGES